MALLLTSRPGYAVNLMKYFDSVFINIGYDIKRRLEFIDKFAAETACEESESYFQSFKARIEADGVLSELCRNPLNLSILCMLVGETNLDLPKTRTALYEEVGIVYFYITSVHLLPLVHCLFLYSHLSLFPRGFKCFQVICDR